MKFRVQLSSKPGRFAQYEDFVDVEACDADEAVGKALDKLRRTSFQDRPWRFWNVDRVDTLGH